MTPAELEIQRHGYAAALISHEVMGAIGSGFIGEIALTYVEWAGSNSQRVVVDWTVVRTREDAVAFAAALTRQFPTGMRRTSISGALTHAADSLKQNAFDGLRQVIDVSGDGPNNQGLPVQAARDAALADGIIINGLPLMTRDGMDRVWGLDDLDAYYRNCVIGGAGAFAIPVTDWPQFAEAVRRKLVLEIVGLPTERVIRAQSTANGQGGYDCLIGEKIWERNRRDWDMQ